MLELSPLQYQLIERLFASGFRPIVIPPYDNALCLHRGECAVLLAPLPNGGFKLLAPATFLVSGNLSVRVSRPSGDVFVFKQHELPATPDRLALLDAFRSDLTSILELPPTQ